MARTSPVHYIEPSAISITPNANNSHRDLAVYVTKDAKIKVLCPRAGIGYSADGAYQEWAFSGRNRRLTDVTGTIPYTIYVRLKKTGDRTGYLVFVKKVQHDNNWIDAYSSLTNDTVNGYSVLYTDGGSEVRVTSPDYYYVRLGDVSASENGQRTVTLDTGILGTDQFNDEWALNPDLLPLRIELGCTINDKDAGPTPYVYWGQRLVLAATLTEGWTGADIQRFDHWEITRDSGDSGADDLWNHPIGTGGYRTLDGDGRITLSHVRGDDDDFNGAVAATFMVKAIGRPESSDSSSSSSSGSPELIVLRTATINIHAETVEKYELALSTNIVGYNPRTQTFDPASITVRLRATTQRGTVFELTMGQLANAGLTVEFAAVDTDVWTPLVFSGASGDTATASLVTAIAFAAQQSLNVRLVRTAETDSSDSDSSSSGEQATIELMRYTIAFVRDGEDSREREWIFYRSAEAVTFGTGQGQTTPPAAISGGQVSPEGAATGNDADKNQDGWVPQGWYDEMQGANEDNPYEYGSFRDFIHENDSSSSDSSSSDGGGHWGPFSMPKIWSHFGKDAHEIGINILERTNFDRDFASGLSSIKEKWVPTRNDWTKVFVVDDPTVKGRCCLKIDGSNAVDNYFDIEQSVLGKLKPNTKYTLSFWGCNSTADKLQVFLFGDAYSTGGSKLFQGKLVVDGVEVNAQDDNGCVMFTAASSPVFHTITFKTASTIPTRAEIWFRAANATISYVCMPKLEEGDTATAYVADEGDLIGVPGDDGVSPYQLKLSDEVALIDCDEDGTVLPGSSYEISRLMIQQGINSKFTDFNINIVLVGISCNGKSSSFSLSEETKESADSTGYYSLMPSAITQDAAEIRVIATLKTDSNFVLTGGYKINKNKTGATGKTGPSYYPAGEYDASTNNAFSRTDEMCPVVLSEGNYYYLKQYSNLRSGSRIPPTGNQYSSNYWGLAENFQVVFIKALFAMFAKLGSFVVSGDWFISQYGKLKSSDGSTLDVGSSNYETKYINSSGTITQDNSGRVGYTYFKSADPKASTNADPGELKFAPKLAIDAKSGKIIGGDVEFVNGKFTGEIHASSGNFGKISIVNGKIVSDGGQFEIDANGNAKFSGELNAATGLLWGGVRTPYKSVPLDEIVAYTMDPKTEPALFVSRNTQGDQNGWVIVPEPSAECDGLEIRIARYMFIGTDDKVVNVDVCGYSYDPYNRSFNAYYQTRHAIRFALKRGMEVRLKCHGYQGLDYSSFMWYVENAADFTKSGSLYT